MGSSSPEDTTPGAAQAAEGPAASGVMLSAGTQLGSYRIQRLLGRGGMSEVYLGHDEALARDVAIKVLNPRLEGVEEALARFLSEARAIARLSHPHIVQVFEFNPDNDPPYLVMEWVRGGTVRDLLQTQSPLPVKRVLDCARQMLSGLAAAHDAGIVHRDIKPGNMLLAADEQYKLTDFGLARGVDADARLTATGTVVGTVHYLAPEVARGEPAAPRSDLYSLGASLYEMLCGRTPYEGKSPLRLIHRIASAAPTPLRSRAPEVPPVVEAWIARLMAWNPDRRYVHAWQALSDLKGIRAALGGSPMDSSAVYPAAPPVDVTLPVSGTGLPEAQGSDAANPADADQDAGAVGSLTVPWQPGAHALPDDQVEEVVRKLDEITDQASRLQRLGRNPLERENLVDLAVEAGVAPEAVRQAIKWQRRHRDAALSARAVGLRRGRWQGVAIGVGLALLAGGLVALGLHGLKARAQQSMVSEWERTQTLLVKRGKTEAHITQRYADGRQRDFIMGPNGELRQITETLTQGRRRIIEIGPTTLRISEENKDGKRRLLKELPHREPGVRVGLDAVWIQGVLRIDRSGVHVAGAEAP